MLAVFVSLRIASFSIDAHFLYFQHQVPFTNPLKTRLSAVKEIPYFVSDKFLRTYYRDRFQLGRVEHMVERAYEQYLVDECVKQKNYKQRLQKNAAKSSSEEEKARRLKHADEFELSRCQELSELYPHRKQPHVSRR